MTKRYLIGANFKMNPTPAGALEKGSAYTSNAMTDVVVFPAMTDLKTCIAAQTVTTGAQCGQCDDCGAFTGDVSMAMLKELGVTHVLCGHSERRMHHGETDENVAKQTESALRNNLTPIVCVGETADQREMGETEEVLRKQLSLISQTIKKASERAGLAGPARGGLNIGKGESTRGKPLGLPLVIAYEPVWAIGTGKTPTPKEADAVHALIKSLLPAGIRVLYGGSVTGKNAASFFAEPNIDGALVGGASLKPTEFAAIVKAAA